MASLGATLLALMAPDAIRAVVEDQERALVLLVLVALALACARLPLRYGIKEAIVTLDRIPLVLIVVLYEPGVAAAAGVVTTVGAMLGRPRLAPGWRGRFWQVAMPFTSALVMGSAAWLAEAAGLDRELGAVLLVPAFLIVAGLELAFDAAVVIEVEATDPGGSRSWLRRSLFPSVVNIVLPTFATVSLTPYLAVPWQFMLLLLAFTIGAYGALWVASSQQLEERRGERLKDTFGRHVPEGIVEDNVESMQEIELGGEQHALSVLFCDIRGFTSWSEDKGATEVITELNVLLTELSASVMSTGGTLDKFTGDGLMAFWGAPVPVEDHADRACRAALDMLRRLDAVNQRRAEDGQAPFRIGVAVHSGTAVVGNVGHERRLDYTAIGDTVNTTARLEASTKDLGAVLLVSRETIDLVGPELRERAMRIGDVTMKGRARAVEAWVLEPLRPDLDGVDDEFAA